VFSKVNDKQTSSFWLCAAGLKAFYESNGRLPVSGVLPDMVSTTEFYLQLQNLYIAKAK
jgi:amyloid beta precursor protein binding protein 1